MIADIAKSRSVYLDSNLIIYFVEQVPGFFETAKGAFGALAEREARVMTSELTVAECLYQPSRGGHSKLVSVYEEFFSPARGLRLIPLDGGVARQAAKRGGGWGLKLLDAIHFVSALEAGCDVFLTADRAFTSIPDLAVVQV